MDASLRWHDDEKRRFMRGVVRRPRVRPSTSLGTNESCYDLGPLLSLPRRHLPRRPVDKVVLVGPGAAAVGRLGPVLADGAAGFAGEAHALLAGASVRKGDVRDEDHRVALHAADEVAPGVAAVGPELAPAAPRRNPGVEAAAGRAGAGERPPVLSDDAAVVEPLDQAVGDELLGAGRVDVPAADPEVELAMLGRGADRRG